MEVNNMTAYNLALRMELDGEKFYKEQEEKANIDSIKKVFNLLAAEEHKHYLVVKDMIENGNYNMVNSNLKDDVKTIFAGKTFDKKDLIGEAEQIDIYRYALQTEKDSIKLYENLKEETEDENQKHIYDALIGEEKKHAELFDNFVDLLLRPMDWVESAEFNIRIKY
jgi:rubrerythrin